MPARIRSPVPPRVSSTKEANSSISKPTYRLNRSPVRKAFDTPAVSTRKVGWKIEIGVSRRRCSSSWPSEKSRTSRQITDDTSSSSVESRSATSEMPCGAGQPAIRATCVPTRSARYASTAATATISARTVTDTARWAFGRRPRIRVTPAPKRASRIGIGTSQVIDPPPPFLSR
ncbi:hypothetical protein SDC9_89980 [bioreactor metagenome]|uniref:Uncharacterized protein n=1 Tax=bioreactor metagenome TaxID=1076179 RepID=A0A644ZRB8_9ZZZZ